MSMSRRGAFCGSNIDFQLKISDQSKSDLSGDNLASPLSGHSDEHKSSYSSFSASSNSADEVQKQLSRSIEQA